MTIEIKENSHLKDIDFDKIRHIVKYVIPYYKRETYDSLPLLTICKHTYLAAIKYGYLLPKTSIEEVLCGVWAIFLGDRCNLSGDRILNDIGKYPKSIFLAFTKKDTQLNYNILKYTPRADYIRFCMLYAIISLTKNPARLTVLGLDFSIACNTFGSGQFSPLLKDIHDLLDNKFKNQLCV